MAKNFSKVATFDEGMSEVSNFGKVIIKNQTER